MRYFKFDRLVRDENVYQILQQGDLPKYRYADETEYVKLLKNKLLEVSQDLVNGKDNQFGLEELVDVMEIVECFLMFMNKNMRDLKTVQLKKRKKNGSFVKRIYVEYVRCEDRSKLLDYYLKNKNKYPELVGL